jgi:arylsulfatase A-like enzyme
MFTGIPPIANGIVSNGTMLGPQPLVWKALHDAGWTTAGFVAGFPLHGRYGWAQGMDLYDDDFGRLAGVQSLTLVKAWNQVALRDHALRERPAAQVLARAVPWLRANREGRYFAWVHLYDAHGPYESAHNDELGDAPRSGTPLAKLPAYWPARDRTITSPAWLAMAYDAEIRTVDDAIGALLDALGPELDRTLVVVLADHGESLGEHDVWFDHGDDLYDPVLRIPWIVRYPPLARAGVRVPCQVGAIDLAPTILGIAGVEDATAREGLDRRPELAGAPCRPTPVVSTTVAGRQVTPPPVDHALRADARKTILHADGRVEHYDNARDPFERVNRDADPVSDAAAAFLRGRASAVTGAESDRTTQSLLEALGYVDAPR